MSRLNSVSSGYMVIKLVTDVCRLLLAIHAARNISPNMSGAILGNMCMMVACGDLTQTVMLRQQSNRAGFNLLACVVVAQQDRQERI